MIQFTIMGIPTAKGRPRFFMGKKFIHAYTPAATRHYEDSVISQALPYKPDTPLDIPLAVELKFYFPIPQSAPKKFKARAITETVPVAKKPDLDNCIKSVVDALNTIFWTDDKLIVETNAKKFYSERPRIEVSIREVLDG